jgi:hypothetical protein
MKDTLIKTLMPWLCYAGLSFLGLPKVAAPAALLALATGCLLLGSRVKPVDLVMMVYFTFVAIGVGFMHWSWLGSLQPVIAPALLAFMAFGTMLLRRPFTLSYARESVKDPDMWENPHFYRVNYILSALWGSAFLIAALSQAWAQGRSEMLWLATLVGFVATGFVAWFTWWFPPWYHKNFFEPMLVKKEVAG